MLYFIKQSYGKNSSSIFARYSRSKTVEECDPLLPTKIKQSTLEKFRHEKCPMIFWHVQKSGGTYFTGLFDHEYEKRGHTRQNTRFYQRFDADALEITKWEQTFRSQGYYALFMEPGNIFRTTFPNDFRSSQQAQILLNKTIGTRYEGVWNDYIHVITIRKPLDLAMSALRFQFHLMGGSIYSVCSDHNVTTNDCMKELFRIKDKKLNWLENYFNKEQLNRIREEILGNFTINHLSLMGDLEEAKERLSRFHLIIDLSYQNKAYYLISCVLGWKNKFWANSNTNNAVKSHDIFENLSNETIARWSEYLRYDQELYGTCSVIMAVMYADYDYYDRPRC
jgi:hypothetical protein